MDLFDRGLLAGNTLFHLLLVWGALHASLIYGLDGAASKLGGESVCFFTKHVCRAT